MPPPDLPAPIRDNARLAELPARFGAADSIATDTEFNRSSTYRPQLCLLQLAADGELALIDMLTQLDTAPLVSLLTEAPGLKLFHAASQDLEVLELTLGILPNRIFDTQIAAGLLGYPAQVGYAALVADILGIELDKGATRTDWSRRPLSARQLAYAAADVVHLHELYQRLRERLAACGREGWALEDSERLLDPARYRVAPEQAWQRLGAIPYLPVAVQRRARALATWRERRAQRIDRPRQWVLNDKLLLAIAQTNPRDAAALASIPELPPAIARRQGQHIITALTEAEQTHAEAIVQRRRSAAPDEASLKRLAAIVRARAEELKIAPELLATRRELAALLRGEIEQRVTSGWRREVLGEALLAAL